MRLKRVSCRKSRRRSASNCGAGMEARGAGNNSEVEVRYSKRLPQSNKDLCRLDSRQRIQVAAEIDSDRAHRCCVAQADTDRVAVLICEVFESNTIEDVSAVIKRRKR